MFDYNTINWKLYGDKTVLDLFSCAFNIEDNSYIFTFNVLQFLCNGTELDSSVDDFFNGPFTVKLNKPLRLWNCKEVTYDEEDPSITIDGEVYHIINSDFVYFLSDFQANTTQAYGNLMKYLAKYIKNEYT